MLARIKTKNGSYNSIVFVLIKKGWNSSVIVFNEKYNGLELFKMWKPKRNIFIYNTEEDADWVKGEKIEGYSWAIENISKRCFRTKINPAILDKCKELQATVYANEWFEIKNQIDIEGLMECSIGFHDSYVKNIYNEAGKQYILFDTTWDCEILFELEGNFDTNLFKDYGHIAIGNEYPLIMDSAMFFENGFIHWVDDESIKSSVNLDKTESHYFCAKNVKWKLII